MRKTHEERRCYPTRAYMLGRSSFREKWVAVPKRALTELQNRISWRALTGQLAIGCLVSSIDSGRICLLSLTALESYCLVGDSI
jgi:hypothetical protein